MKSSGSFVRQAAILAAASLFVRLLGFLYRIPLTHLIGDHGNFYYNTAYYIYTFAISISALALPVTVSRLTSERIALGQYRNAHELFKTALGFSVITGLAAALILGFAAQQVVRFGGFPPEVAYAVRAIAPAVFFVSVMMVLRGYFQGMKTTLPTAVSQSVEQVFKVVFSLWLAFQFFDAAYLQFSAAAAGAGTAIGALAALIVVIFIYSLVSKGLRERAESDKNSRLYEGRGKQAAAIIRTAFPMIVGTGIVALATILDTSMAAALLTASEAFTEHEIAVLIGQFQGKFIVLTTLPVSLSMALSAAVIPEISSSQAKMDIPAIKHKTNMSVRISMLLSIPAAMGLGVLADPIIALLFPAHPDGGWLLRYGAVSVIFLALVQILTGVLQGIGRVGLPVIGVVIGVIVKIPINYFLMAIPSINILGAVISTIVCFMVAAAFNLFFLRRITGILPELSSAFAKPVLASVGMGLICYIIYNAAINIMPNAASTVLSLVLGLAAYVFFMCLIKGFKQSDIEALPLPAGIRSLLFYN